MTSKPRLAPLKRHVPPAPPMPEPSMAFPPARLLPLPGNGPEDVVVASDGTLLTGLEGGAIVRIDPSTERTEIVATTGGRPLGLEALPDGRALVCDARRGLLRVDPGTGQVETLVCAIAATPLRFCSNATTQRDGTVWFTESTTRFDYETFPGAFLEHRPSGRLLRYDTDGSVDVVLKDLYFANGVALLPDESALLFAETANYSISRLTLVGPEQGRRETVLDNLPGFPDNMSTFVNGRSWVPMTNPRNRLLDRLAQSSAFLRHLLWRIPDRLRPGPTPITWLMAIDGEGRILVDLHQQRSDFHMATGAAESGGSLYVASPEEAALLCLDWRDPAELPEPSDEEHRGKRS